MEPGTRGAATPEVAEPGRDRAAPGPGLRAELEASSPDSVADRRCDAIKSKRPGSRIRSSVPLIGSSSPPTVGERVDASVPRWCPCTPPLKKRPIINRLLNSEQCSALNEGCGAGGRVTGRLVGQLLAEASPGLRHGWAAPRYR